MKRNFQSNWWRCGAC